MNGVDAVVKFTENRDSIDAVLLDVIMPRMNGREACDEILKVRPDTKVLFMSGKDKCAPENVTGYLPLSYHLENI